MQLSLTAGGVAVKSEHDVKMLAAGPDGTPIMCVYVNVCECVCCACVPSTRRPALVLPKNKESARL